MARHTTPQDILAAARKRNEGRLAAIEKIVGEFGTQAAIRQAEEDLEAAIAAARVAVDEARARDAKAYAAALRAGWSEAELRDVGIRRPGAAPARKRASSSRPPAQPGKPAGGDVERQVNDAFSEQLDGAMQGAPA